MKLLKEPIKKIKEQFGFKEQFMLHLADLKWQSGYSCH